MREKNITVKQDINFLEYPLWRIDENNKEGLISNDIEGFTYIAGCELLRPYGRSF